jgi:hypothetical protein
LALKILEQSAIDVEQMALDFINENVLDITAAMQECPRHYCRNSE